MPPRHCCCAPGSCNIGTDDFNRADANPPTGNWDVVSGEWEILDNTLQMVTEGVLITTLRQPAPTVAGAPYTTYFEVELTDFPMSGTKSWGVICGYTAPTTFDWIELNYDATTSEVLPIFWRRVSGTDTLIMDQTTHPAGGAWTINPGEPFWKFSFCYATVYWSVTAFSFQTDWVYCPGGQAALPADTDHGMNGFLKGTFDNWDYQIHKESNPQCNQCTCYCNKSSTDYACYPELMLVRMIAGSNANCYPPPYDTNPPPEALIEVVLRQADADTSGNPPAFTLSPSKRVWRSDVFEVNGVTYWWIATCDDQFELKLICLPYPAEAVTGGMIVYWTAGYDITLGYSLPRTWIRSISTCDPLLLKFTDATNKLAPDVFDVPCYYPDYWEVEITDP